MFRRKRKDLESGDLKKMSWEPDKSLVSLNDVFKDAQNYVKSAINWYLQSKRRKKKGAVFLRVGAILTVSVAGILPMLSQIFLDDGKSVISPAWASVFLAAAAALVAMDRFFGFSSGWMRYIATELRLRKILQEYQMDWETEKSTWKGSHPDREQVQRMLVRTKAFRNRINTIIQEETNTWIAEFQSTLKQLDEAAKAKAEVSEIGGLNIVVSNGDACAKGWKLSIDGGSEKSYLGKTAAIHDLVPGVHTIKVEGNIKGKPKQAEIVASIPAGGIGNVQLTLS